MKDTVVVALVVGTLALIPVLDKGGFEPAQLLVNQFVADDEQDVTLVVDHFSTTAPPDGTGFGLAVSSRVGATFEPCGDDALLNVCVALVAKFPAASFDFTR